MPEVIMPRLSDSMEEGTILRWLKRDGEMVQRGDELLEIETDKATMIYEADAPGILTITVKDGAAVPVGAVIGHLGAHDQAPAPGRVPEDAERPTADGRDGARASVGATSVGARHESAPKASPLARRTAKRLGIALSAVTGSGPHGRILKADVVTAAQRAPAGSSARAAPAGAVPGGTLTTASGPAPAPAVPSGPDSTTGETSFQELGRTQAVIARRVAESRATIPEFALELDIDMSAAIELRARLMAIAELPPSVTAITVKACAMALRRHPRVNGSYQDGRFRLHSRINVGVAVAAEDGLIVPTVFDADAKSVGVIASETRELIDRVRARKITPPELSGATFTVSNLGMFGIDRFEAIINPPQAAILCVGAIRKRPVVVDGELTIRPIMSTTLACDHRILYGADAAQFFTDVRRLLEEPLAMTL